MAQAAARVVIKYADCGAFKYIGLVVLAVEDRFGELENRELGPIAIQVQVAMVNVT